MKDWSFDTVAHHFDEHIREQLPFYDLLNDAVAFITTHYLPKDGLVYDIGASTGNMYEVLAPLLAERNARYIGIEKNPIMHKKLQDRVDSPSEAVLGDATLYPYRRFDVAILSFTLMFLSPREQESLLARLKERMNKGACIIVVDKCLPYSGYLATVMKRLSIHWKLMGGTAPHQIIDKEMALCGVQRPANALKYETQFFQLGEFSAWIIEEDA